MQPTFQNFSLLRNRIDYFNPRLKNLVESASRADLMWLDHNPRSPNLVHSKSDRITKFQFQATTGTSISIADDSST
ncbi:hypothetical protein N7468_007499 [Penicillium chermesinum]|uniref:Uncharacterized protein n=1 Tax=Penicillium chermesinum TaxID=63820 RepID=A0A9W9NUD5_9EURO|nr:uncharacterized protein N7468_007499 [Penicillium chermesinum]KAJ5226274.1 hypothetical protein N7468_007499 [Penicillium chermesinum]